MSTRGVIARKVGHSSFKGVYHHWDSYPSGLGKELWHIYHGYFQGDLGAMLHKLIDEHPAGWSSILGANWDLAPGYFSYPKDDTLCEECGKEQWRHYRQYYPARKAQLPPKKIWDPKNDVLVLGHSFKMDPTKAPNNAQCYCHVERHEERWDVTELNASGSGCEYAYVFDEPKKEMLILSSYREDGKKMIGMFGVGDPNSTWMIIAKLALNGPEPRWDNLPEPEITLPLEDYLTPRKVYHETDPLGEGI
ncbi:MAG: hypothetical protein A4E48_00237 [Methanosaeta sp. PtaU1.Bin060]|nr:MAG: hypothetical protein A4E48_00237 [Methanosaeta sp. PtaU1.Bin060]